MLLSPCCSGAAHAAPVACAGPLRSVRQAEVLRPQVEEMNQKYVKMSNLDEVRDLWTGTYESSAVVCMHGASCEAGMKCSVRPSSIA